MNQVKNPLIQTPELKQKIYPSSDNISDQNPQYAARSKIDYFAKDKSIEINRHHNIEQRSMPEHKDGSLRVSDLEVITFGLKNYEFLLVRKMNSLSEQRSKI